MSAITLCCKNCAAYAPESDTKRRGKCHRYPPEYRVDGNSILVGFPPVLENDWCMQWSAIGHKPLGLGDGR